MSRQKKGRGREKTGPHEHEGEEEVNGGDVGSLTSDELEKASREGKKGWKKSWKPDTCSLEGLPRKKGAGVGGAP